MSRLRSAGISPFLERHNLRRSILEVLEEGSVMSSGTLSARAEQYFYSINPLAQRIGQDITATKEAYEGLWNTLSISERNQAINETIITPEVALKYTLKKVEITKELPEWYPKLRIQTGMKYVIDETGSVSKLPFLNLFNTLSLIYLLLDICISCMC